MAESMNIFVIWDHQARDVRIMLQSVSYLEDLHYGGALWKIPGLSPDGPLLTVEDTYQSIRDADHIIALVDRPNANVGWEVGLALGWRKSIRLGHVGRDRPRWTERSAIRGWIQHRICDVSDLGHLLSGMQVPLKAPTPPDANAHPLLLCPAGAEGSALREVARRHFPNLRLLAEDGWGLLDLPTELSSCSQILWVLSSSGEESVLERGADNVGNAVVAGVGRALGWGVSVFRSTAVTPVPDVQSRELVFEGVNDFVPKLSRVLAQPQQQQRVAPDGLRLREPRLVDILHGVWVATATTGSMGQMVFRIQATGQFEATFRRKSNDGAMMRVDGRWELDDRQLILTARRHEYNLVFQFSSITMDELRGICKPNEPMVWKRSC